MALRRGFDVVALGELVVDLVPALNADGQPCFVPKPGGAPGNVAVGVARLGSRAAMLSKVGDEAFGRLLVATLANNGVSTDGVLTTHEGNTSLAVVTVDADGERDFILYRKGCADFDLCARRGRNRHHSRLTDTARRQPAARRAGQRRRATPRGGNRARGGRPRLRRRQSATVVVAGPEGDARRRARSGRGGRCPQGQ